MPLQTIGQEQRSKPSPYNRLLNALKKDPMPIHKRAALPAVTGVRFLLAMWVVTLHMVTANAVLSAWCGRAPIEMQGVILSGASAVGVFFLLSGFVLAYNYDLNQTWNAKRLFGFWSARFARIYPVYLFALIVGLPSLFAGLLKEGPIHGLSLARRMAEVLLLVQAWNPFDALFWGGPAWSLSVEAFFYLCFPVCGAILWRIKGRWQQIAALGTLWATCCAASYAIGLWKAPMFLAHGPVEETFWTGVIKWNPLIRLPEFLAGIVLCRIFLELQKQPAGWVRAGNGWTLYLPGLAIACVAVAESRFIPPAVLHTGLLIPASAAIILGLSLGGGMVEQWLSHPRMVLLGQASYAVYLLHMQLYSYFAAMGKRVVRTEMQAWCILAGYLVCLILVSLITFFQIEERSRRAILRKLYAGKPEAPPQIELSPANADPM